MSETTSLIIALLALAGNAFFVGAEFALISARRSSVELLAAKGKRTAKITLRAMERVSLMLAGAQLGITLCSLVFAAMGEPVVAHWLEGPFGALGIDDAPRHIIAFAIALSAMVWLHVVLGEMVPKNLALARSTSAALVMVPPLYAIVWLTKPLILALNMVANGMVRLLGVKPRDEIASSFSRDEVMGFVKESHREGLLSSEEEQLLSSSLAFDSHTIQPLIVPIDALVLTSTKPTVDELERLVAETGYSRFPVPAGKKPGKLRGYVHIKDVLGSSKSVSSKIHPLPRLAPSASTRHALRTMQQSEAHIAQVLGPRGKLLGVVMLEDVLERLVGTIKDTTQKKP